MRFFSQVGLEFGLIAPLSDTKSNLDAMFDIGCLF